MKTGRGIPVFAGVAIGPAVVYKRADPDVEIFAMLKEKQATLSAAGRILDIRRQICQSEL